MIQRIKTAAALLSMTSLACLLVAGCGRQSAPTPPASPATNQTPANGDSTSTEPPVTAGSTPLQEIAPQSFEASASELLAARLPAEEASAGWIRLFDGATLFGWEIAGAANWRVKDGSIVVDGGEQSLLCTSVPWKDYELLVEFRAAPETNSGIFLRTPLEPQDPQQDCYEVNIAPDDNPFPTAGIVGRKRAEAVTSPETADQWRTMKMNLQGGQLDVWVDDQLVCQYSDPKPLPAGRIGLQHNSGRAEFRNVRLRPLGLDDLLDESLSQWTKYPQMPGEFTVTQEGWLHVQGGRTQLESKSKYADFVLLAEYKLPQAEMNSGVFFRCIPGDEMMGYECQLSNETKDGNPLAPADCGSGGIFRRQDARIVAGEPDQWATLLLVANREQIAAWVNGIQVSNWYDDRPADANPRKGKRLDAGTIMIQGHDPGTDATLKQLKIVAVRSEE